MKVKSRILSFSVLILVCLLATCSSDYNISYDKDQHGINFLGAIGELPQAKATNTQWEATDAIGIYMKQKGEPLATHSQSDGNNIKYTTSFSDGKFAVANAAEAISYPLNGQEVDFVAYYPFQPSIANYTYKVDVANQQDQSSIDLLFSNNAVGYSKENPALVTLVFSHQLTKIQLNISKGTGVADITGVKATTKGMLTKAGFNLSTVTLTDDVTSVADIVFATQAKDENMLAEAIILPMTAISGRTIAFEVGGKTYSWSIPDATAFVGGKRYSYDVTLKEKEVVVINPNGTITDWDDVQAENIEAEFGDELPTILINQTNASLSGVEVGANIVLKGSITSVTNLVSAKIISKVTGGAETKIDLLTTFGVDLTLDFEKTIIATADLEEIRIEVADKNEQKATETLQVKVGYHSYRFLATASGSNSAALSILPFMSASEGSVLGYCAAKTAGIAVDVAFATYESALNIVATNVATANVNKFKHPSGCALASWTTSNKTKVQISPALGITRSNFSETTVAMLKAETPLTTGGTDFNYLTTGTNVPADVAFMYQTIIDGEPKRVIFCLDKIEDGEIPSTAVKFWVKMIVEK